MTRIPLLAVLPAAALALAWLPAATADTPRPEHR